MTEQPRRQGRTFRLLLKCLLDMSQGTKVVLVARDKDQSHGLFCSALGMVESHIKSSSDLRLDVKNRTIRIVGCNGQLVVVDPEGLLPYKEHRQLSGEFKFVRDL